jgi:hypothetical protein
MLRQIGAPRQPIFLLRGPFFAAIIIIMTPALV